MTTDVSFSYMTTACKLSYLSNLEFQSAKTDSKTNTTASNDNTELINAIKDNTTGSLRRKPNTGKSKKNWKNLFGRWDGDREGPNNNQNN